MLAIFSFTYVFKLQSNQQNSELKLYYPRVGTPHYCFSMEIKVTFRQPDLGQLGTIGAIGSNPVNSPDDPSKCFDECSFSLVWVVLLVNWPIEETENWHSEGTVDLIFCLVDSAKGFVLLGRIS